MGYTRYAEVTYKSPTSTPLAFMGTMKAVKPKASPFCPEVRAMIRLCVAV